MPGRSPGFVPGLVLGRVDGLSPPWPGSLMLPLPGLLPAVPGRVDGRFAPPPGRSLVPGRVDGRVPALGGVEGRVDGLLTDGGRDGWVEGLETLLPPPPELVGNRPD